MNLFGQYTRKARLIHFGCKSFDDDVNGCVYATKNSLRSTFVFGRFQGVQNPRVLENVSVGYVRFIIVFAFFLHITILLSVICDFKYLMIGFFSCHNRLL